MTRHNRTLGWFAAILLGWALNKGRQHLARLRPYWVAKYRGQEADLRRAALSQSELAGVDLHNELGLLVEAGFRPLEALQAATIRPAEFLGRSDAYGTIERGKVADLVLLDANPLEDISHTRMIRAVILGGRLIPVAELRERLLRDALSEAAPR